MPDEGENEEDKNVTESAVTQTKKESFFSFSRLFKNMLSIFFGSSNKSNANMRYVDDLLADGQNNNTEQKSTDLEKENTQTKGRGVGEEGRSATRQASEQIKPNNNTQSQTRKPQEVADQPTAPSKSTTTTKTANQSKGETKMKTDNSNNGKKEPEDFEKALAGASPEVRAQFNDSSKITSTDPELNRERSESVSSFDSDTTTETVSSEASDYKDGASVVDADASGLAPAPETEVAATAAVSDLAPAPQPVDTNEALVKRARSLSQREKDKNFILEIKGECSKAGVNFDTERLNDQKYMRSIYRELIKQGHGQESALLNKFILVQNIVKDSNPFVLSEDEIAAGKKLKKVFKANKLRKNLKNVVEKVLKQKEVERKDRSTQRWKEFKSDMGEMLSDKVTRPAVATAKAAKEGAIATGNAIAQGASATGKKLAQGARMGTRMAAGASIAAVVAPIAVARGVAGTVTNTVAAAGGVGVAGAALVPAAAGVGFANAAFIAGRAAQSARRGIQDGAVGAYNSYRDHRFRAARNQVSYTEDKIAEILGSKSNLRKMGGGILSDDEKEVLQKSFEVVKEYKKAYLNALEKGDDISTIVDKYRESVESFAEFGEKIVDLETLAKDMVEKRSDLSWEVNKREEILEAKAARNSVRQANSQKLWDNTKGVADAARSMVTKPLGFAERRAVDAVMSVPNVLSGEADKKFGVKTTTGDILKTAGRLLQGMGQKDRQKLVNAEAKTGSTLKDAISIVDRDRNSHLTQTKKTNMLSELTSATVTDANGISSLRDTLKVIKFNKPENKQEKKTNMLNEIISATVTDADGISSPSDTLKVIKHNKPRGRY